MERARIIVIMVWIWGLALVSLALFASPAPHTVHAQSAPMVTTPTPTSIPLPTLTPPPPSTSGSPVADSSGPSSYIVKAGDTLLSVAIETGLDLEEAYCLITPDFHADQPLVVGDELDIFTPNMACHAVENGETLEGIAARYNSTPAEIRAMAWNQWPSELSDMAVLPSGGHLRVPRGPALEQATTLNLTDEEAFLPIMLRQPVGASPFTVRAMSAAGAPPVGGPRVVENAPQMAPVPDDWPYGSGYFAWPLYGWLSQGFDADHRAIDVAARAGTLVTASDRGVVARAGWNSQGYGNFVVIDHNIDYVTLYGHLSEVLVAEGEIVAQGQPIGIVGSTGNSTGPHLHFEIRDFGRRTDPIELLVR